MLAYHGKESLRQDYLRIAQMHEDADSYVKGVYWQEQEKRGCNIGCWTKAGDGGHARLAGEMGVPVEILYLSDGLFEALPDPLFKAWSRRMAGAIQPGADLEGAWARVMQWLLTDGEWGLSVLATSMSTRAAIGAMAGYFVGKPGGLPEGRWELDREKGALVGNLEKSLSGWKSWDEQARRDMRAGRGALEVWEAWEHGPKVLARASWAARAAWGAWDAYILAQADSLLQVLGTAPVVELKK